LWEKNEQIFHMTDVYGFGKEPDENLGTQDTRYGIEYTPINELKTLPVYLNDTMKYVDVKDNWKEVFSVHVGFTVYDVIGAILYEISWAGSPKHRDAQWGRIVGDVEEARKQLDEQKNKIA
jgi:hypothetical protein